MLDAKPSDTSPIVHYDLHLANSISSRCEFDTKDSFFGNMDYYTNNNYTYAPFPFEGEYYDFDEGEIKSFNPGQWLSVDHFLVTAIEKLLDYDFLLIDYSDLLFKHGEDTFGKVTPSESLEIKKNNERKETIIKRPSVISDEVPEYTEKAYKIAEEENAYQIITLADINRRPVKDMLYPLIASTESIFKKLIQSEFRNVEPLIADMKPRSIGRWKKSELNDIQMHPAEYMNLGEMKKIVGESEVLRSELGFESRNQFKKATKGIIDLRNDVMHASRTLVRNKSELESLNTRINRLEEIIEKGGGEIKRRDQPDMYK